MMARNRRLMKNRSLVRFHYYDHWIHKHCLQISLPSITRPNGYIKIMVTVKLNVATDNSKLFLWLLFVDKDRKIKFVRFQWHIVIPDWIDRYNVTVAALLTCGKISNSFPLSILWSTPGGVGELSYMKERLLVVPFKGKNRFGYLLDCSSSKCLQPKILQPVWR